MHNLTDLIETSYDMPISGVTSDSREVRHGFAFVALKGNKQDGAKFIADAVHNGAKAIIAEVGTVLPDEAKDTVFVEHHNPRAALAEMAAKFYSIQPDQIVAVTGTNGKTSTVNFCQQLWHLSGLKQCASIGTLGVRGPGMVRSGSMTTPDPVSLHAELADLSAAGITHLAMEASSHGIEQCRLDGVVLSAAAFTNLSHDHLDYHRDMERYFQAKARLFSTVLKAGSRAVINADDDYAQPLIGICEKAGHQVVTYGHVGEDYLLKSHAPTPQGQEIEIIVGGQDYILTLPLVGEFQVMNALCALALTQSDPALLSQLRGVPGRLQLVKGHPKGAVYVDYAHTPDALEHVLNALRPHTLGRLICIVGCGGDRDMRKRPAMGRIAFEKSDLVIVTDDNPRSEDPASIRAAIIEQVPNVKDIGDRKEAISFAVENMQDGDVLLVAGKGHEEGQEIAGIIYPFNDVNEVEKAIERVNV